MQRSVIVPGLVALAALQLAQGLWMVVDPGSFFDTLGPFGERNDHYTRDNATISLAVGVCALLAVGRASWRVPVLAVTAVWFGLHAVNHLADIGEADPEAVGAVDFVALVVVGVALAWLVAVAQREERA